MTTPNTFTTVSLDATVRANRPVSSGLLRLDLTLPEVRPRDLVLGFQPGQFAMLNLTGPGTLVFSRPFSILDWQGDVVSFLYRVVGRGTAAMADLKEGQSMNVLGPLGHPFPVLEANQAAVLIGGGVGLPPVASWLARHGRSQDRAYFGGRDGADVPWQELQGNWQVSVDEAADMPADRAAFVGRVTELVAQDAQLDESFERVILACGPVPMLKAASTLASQKGWPCLVSLEEHMGCGYGACKGCVVPVVSAGPDGWRNATCCQDGPVFSAQEVLWDRYAANPFATVD
jgi:dihydroorotate dehydrogenase electron transfer subunit